MVQGLTPSDLEGMRQTQEGLMPDRCDIQELVSTTDVYGGVVRTWTTIYTGIICRVAQISGGPIQAANWMVTLPWDQPFELDYRIVKDSLRLEPVLRNTDVSWKSSTRIWCRETTNA